MYPLIKQSHRIPQTSLSYYSYVIDQCISLKSLTFGKTVHAQLIKVGFNRYTFLGNRCLDLYSRFGSVDYSLKVFGDISCKNAVSWNILLKGFLKFGDLDMACSVFDEMPERDVVSWNSMISGYASCGHSERALGFFWKMQNLGVKPSGFTYSILMSIVYSARNGKEIHGSIFRRGLNVSNVVLGNSLIDMYGKLGIIGYALGVFLTMQKWDAISWNSLIAGCCKSGYYELALYQFHLMISSGYSMDEFTCSVIITCCSNLQNLDAGKQIFAFCVKVGFLCNAIISSATIDMFSKCNRLEDSVQLFQEHDQWDLPTCNSMIASYAWHGFGEDALQLFVLTLREDIRPTEFTFSNILSSISILSMGLGTQVHSLVIKSGLELDAVVASSLMDMYTKFGFIDYAKKIFSGMVIRDLISWNIMIRGLTHNGRPFETLDTFDRLLRRGPPPDQITLAGVLLACSHGAFIDEGMTIFSSMKKSYGVTPDNEHYTCIVNLLCRAGRLDEVVDIIKTMPHEPSSVIWESILLACAIHGDLKVTETLAEKLMDSKSQSPLPYLALARAYEMRDQWEGMVRVLTAMKRKRVKKVVGCSWIGIKNHVYPFKADQLQHHGVEDIYSVLRLLNWEMEDR